MILEPTTSPFPSDELPIGFIFEDELSKTRHKERVEAMTRVKTPLRSEAS